MTKEMKTRLNVESEPSNDKFCLSIRQSKCSLLSDSTMRETKKMHLTINNKYYFLHYLIW